MFIIIIIIIVIIIIIINYLGYSEQEKLDARSCRRPTVHLK